MSDKVIDFPQYRKLSNDKTYYRINSSKHFDEIMIIGKKAQQYSVQAEQYPEMLRINDMLEHDGFESSSKDEFDELLKRFGLKEQ